MKELINRIKNLNFITRSLLLIFALYISIGLALVTIGKITGTKSTNYNFFSQTMNDSWEPMIAALESIKNNPDSSVYQEVFFEKVIRFQYPPGSLLIYDIPQRITGCSYQTVSNVLDIISWFSIIFIGLISAQIILLLLKDSKFQITDKYEIIFIYLIIIGLAFLFYPIRTSFNYGQIQTLLTLFATFSFLLYLKNKQILAGVFIGLICVVKPHWGLIIIWAAIHKKWKMVASFFILSLIIGLISLGFYGFQNHIDYLSVLSFLSRYGESYYHNQSINGLLHRFLFNGLNLKIGNFPPYSQTVYLTTYISSLLLIFLGLFWKFRKNENNFLEFTLVFLTITIASPVTWIYHYGILFPIGLILLVYMKTKIRINNKLYITTLILFTICGQYFYPIPNLLAETKFNLLQSYLFFSAVGILSILYWFSNKYDKINN